MMSVRFLRFLLAVVSLSFVACGGSSSRSRGANQAELPGPAASPEVQRAESLIAAGDPESAKEVLVAVLDADPNDARALLDLGIVYEMLGEPERAVATYRRALEVDANFPEVLSNLALLLANEGDYTESIRLLTRATELRPGFAEAHVNLALSYEASGDLDSARLAYEKALGLDASDAMAWANLGMVHLAQGDVSSAKLAFESALENAGDDVVVLQTAGNGLRRSGNPQAAVDAMTRAVKARKHGPTPALYSELALARVAADDLSGGKQALERAIALDDKYAIAHYLLAIVEGKLGNASGAIAHYHRYIELDPNGPHVSKAKQRIQTLRAKN